MPISSASPTSRRLRRRLRLGAWGSGRKPGLTPRAIICRPFRGSLFDWFPLPRGSRPGLSSVAPPGLFVRLVPSSPGLTPRAIRPSPPPGALCSMVSSSPGLTPRAILCRPLQGLFVRWVCSSPGLTPQANHLSPPPGALCSIGLLFPGAHAPGYPSVAPSGGSLFDWFALPRGSRPGLSVCRPLRGLFVRLVCSSPGLTPRANHLSPPAGAVDLRSPVPGLTPQASYLSHLRGLVCWWPR